MSASNSPTIEELTKELELTRNELTKFEKKVADLTEDRDNVEAERDSFKHQLTVMKTGSFQISSLSRLVSLLCWSISTLTDFI